MLVSELKCKLNLASAKYKTDDNNIRNMAVLRALLRMGMKVRSIICCDKELFHTLHCPIMGKCTTSERTFIFTDKNLGVH